MRSFRWVFWNSIHRSAEGETQSSSSHAELGVKLFIGTRAAMLDIIKRHCTALNYCVALHPDIQVHSWKVSSLHSFYVIFVVFFGIYRNPLDAAPDQPVLTQLSGFRYEVSSVKHHSTQNPQKYYNRVIFTQQKHAFLIAAMKTQFVLTVVKRRLAVASS